MARISVVILTIFSLNKCLYCRIFVVIINNKIYLGEVLVTYDDIRLLRVCVIVYALSGVSECFHNETTQINMRSWETFQEADRKQCMTTPHSEVQQCWDYTGLRLHPCTREPGGRTVHELDLRPRRTKRQGTPRPIHCLIRKSKSVMLPRACSFARAVCCTRAVSRLDAVNMLTRVSRVTRARHSAGN